MKSYRSMTSQPIARETKTNTRSRTVPYAGGFFTGLCNRFDRGKKGSRIKHTEKRLWKNGLLRYATS